jgi:hypothetical protein
MAETNRDAEMQIGGRNGANMPFAQKNRKSWSLPVFSSPKAVLLGKILYEKQLRDMPFVP